MFEDFVPEVRKRYYEKYGSYPSGSSRDALNALQPGAVLTAEQVYGNTAQDLIKQTDPLRKALIGQSSDFLTGGMDPTATPEYSAIRSFADQQARQAKDSILETMPSGGTLLDKLADVDIGKARTLTDASASIYGGNLDRAFSLATGTPLTGSMSSLAGLSQLDAARKQSADAAEADEKSAMGSAVGGMAGMYFGGPAGAQAGASAGGK
jgi:hypothetical protein